MPTVNQPTESNPKASRERYEIRFPTEARLSQDAEWCEAKIGGEWRRVRFHDYDEIYSVPGLYEELFYKKLKCSSPRRVVSLLAEVLADNLVHPSSLRAIDVGAGNGIVGDRLREIDVERVIGCDIIPEAKIAAERDRPTVYDEYLVADLTALSDEQVSELRAHRLNLLVTVAALGFNDIPPLAFASAFNLVEEGGWLAFNVKEDFLEGGDDTGFAKLVRELDRQNYIQIHAYRRYPHRLSTAGERLFYVAIIAKKRRHMPLDLISELGL